MNMLSIILWVVAVQLSITATALLYGLFCLYRRTYVIKAGTHGPDYDFSFHTGIDNFKIRVKFNKSCWHKPIENDINKLFGFSYGNHHNNSARFGWRPSEHDETLIEIFVYAYVNGERQHRSVGWVDVDMEHDLSLEWRPEGFFYKIERNEEICSMGTIAMERPKVTWGYYLFPYYGGNNVAPKTMKIKMKKV